MSREGKSKDGGKSKRDSSEEDNTERIRVGKDYQASIPPMIAVNPVRELSAEEEKAIVMWKPLESMDAQKLDAYIKEAAKKHGYNVDQALGMLLFHNYDIERSSKDLENFKPVTEDWGPEDVVLFEQAYTFHGKNFSRIRQMLTDKSIACLVKYYYSSWKKSRNKTSDMDKQEKDLLKNGNSDNNSEKDSNETTDTEEKTPVPEKAEEKPTNSLPLQCAGCGVDTTEVIGTVHGKLCLSCHQHYHRTGALRPTSGPNIMSKRYRPYDTDKTKRRPPTGMSINHDDIVSLATANQSETKMPDILTSQEREIAARRSIIQTNLERINVLTEQNQVKMRLLSPPDSNHRISTRWSPEDTPLAVQGVRQHGKDFATIAAVLGTKSEGQIKAFFVNNRRRYDLDQAVRDLETRNGPPADQDKTTTTLGQFPSDPIDVDEENTNSNVEPLEDQSITTEKRNKE